MNTQTPTSVFHVAVDKNRFYLSSSLMPKEEPQTVYMYGKFYGHQFSVLFQYIVQLVELCDNVERRLLPVILG